MRRRGCFFCDAVESADEEGLVVASGSRALALLKSSRTRPGTCWSRPCGTREISHALDDAELVEIHRLASRA